MHRLRKSIKAAPGVRPPSEPSEPRSSRRLTRREQTEVAALRAHVEELEAARASAPTAPDQTIRKAVTVLFGLLVEQVGRGGAADLLHDNLNNRERAALAGVVTDTSLRILLADDSDEDVEKDIALSIERLREVGANIDRHGGDASLILMPSRHCRMQRSRSAKVFRNATGRKRCGRESSANSPACLAGRPPAERVAAR